MTVLEVVELLDGEVGPRAAAARTRRRRSGSRAVGSLREVLSATTIADIDAARGRRGRRADVLHLTYSAPEAGKPRLRDTTRDSQRVSDARGESATAGTSQRLAHEAQQDEWISHIEDGLLREAGGFEGLGVVREVLDLEDPAITHRVDG